MDSHTKAPCRPRLLQFYSSLYYKDHIKSFVDAEWEKLKTQEPVEGAKPEALVDFCNKMTACCWENKTAAFCKCAEAKLETEHQAEMEVHQVQIATMEVTDTESAEAYHMYIVSVLMFPPGC